MTFEQIMENEHFIPNSEQLPVICSERNTVVSAGAGAGKTAVLSWRFLRLVMQKGVRPEEILTLTFTKKAANEMRERIYSRLMKAKDSLPPDTLESFSKATISTLDSFCAQIVRSDCTSYGLPRDIANLSDEQLSEVAQRLANRFLSDEENAECANAIASLIMPANLMDGFFGIIAKTVSIVGNYDALAITERFLEAVRTEYRRRRELLESMFSALANTAMNDSFRQEFDKIYKDFLDEKLEENEFFNLQKTRNAEIKEIVNEMRPLMGKDSGFAMLQDMANGDDSVSPLQMAVQRFAQMLNEEKRRMGALTFRDVSDLAVVILRNNLKLRSLFKKRFRYIMIDEFQDNNTLQRNLLFLLSERSDLAGEAGVVPGIESLEPDKLFLVGDEKQSIYKFRGADVSVFRRLQDEIGRNGDSLSLSTNYRSQKPLIDHFNSVFQSVLAPSDGGSVDYEARYNPILAGREADATQSKVILSLIRQDQLEDVESGILEAEAVANYCERAISTDDFLVDGKRPKAEDIAIIFRTSTNQMNIEKALKRRAIPYQIAETRSLMLDAVASDFYSFLNCILYPNDKRSWIALLKSPFCGLCDESVLNVMSEDIKDVLDIDKERYESFLRLFDEIKACAFRLTIAQLVEKIYMEGGYRAYIHSNQDRSVFEEHYEYLFSYAIQFDSEGKGLSDYARFLRDKMGTNTKLPEASVLCRERSGVQMMTVHKSKGLEFKVVIFTGVGSKNRNDESKYVFEYGGDLVSSESKGIRKMLEQESALKEEAELKRVMYVALTRAKDHLIVLGGFKTKVGGDVSCGSMLKWYLDAVGADVSSMTCQDPLVTVEDVTDLPIKGASQVTKIERQDMGQEPLPEFRQKVSRIAVTSLDHGNNVLNPSHMLPNFDADSIIGHLNLQTGFGTLCHELLENLLGKGSYEEVQCKLCDSEQDNAVLLTRARKFADGFKSSDFYRCHVEGNETRQELRFYTSDDGDVAVEGVIDLLVLGEKYNLVVDYKTDQFKDPEIHRTQVLTYIKVAEDIFKKPCLGVLYYLRDGSTSQFWNRDGDAVRL